jgi:excisionase family DNA binding protein
MLAGTDSSSVTEAQQRDDGTVSTREGRSVERQTVSIMKACELVGVSRRTIYNWISAGKVEYVRTAGGSIRIFTDTLWRQPDGSTPSSPNLTA